MEKIRSYIYNLMTDKDKSLISHLAKLILWLLSFLYGALLFIRGSLYKLGLIRTKRLLLAKVISVGNITVGGTGKTPIAMKLAMFLKEKGRSPAILLRGYGQDEDAMLRSLLPDIPIMKGKDRVKNGREAISLHKSDTLILDDGFQYKKLKKDFNIILLDSRNPFGNGHLIPRGILRERVSHLKAADVIILTKTSDNPLALSDLKKRLGSISGSAKLYDTYHKPVSLRNITTNEEVSLDFLKGKRVASVSSIGDPLYFNELLKDLGSEVGLKKIYSDHYNYKQKDVDALILSCAKSNLELILTTEKDAVKLTKLNIDKRVNMFSLKIRLEFRRDEDDFINRLLRVCSG